KAGTLVTESVLSEVFKHRQSVKVKNYTEDDARFLSVLDLVNTIKYLINLRYGREKKDDIAYLGNRRIRAVGELLENQARMGIARMEKFFRDRCTVANPEDPNLKPQDLLNPRYLTSAIYDFLKGGMLSQYLDNANPLSAMTHKRRLSALGPGGLTRESAKFEIRDVHPSHYGRICPIETPEGQNIGLVTSLTVYAQTNEYGFIVTPYRRVEKGKVTDKVDYLAAYEEENFVIAQYTPTDEEGRILSDRVYARYKNDIQIVRAEQVHYMDVSPKQVISVSASLIPFLEHDDANRALMGSNMQRQAVPLMFTSSPLVGTGMEKKVAFDSGAVVLAERGGYVEEVDSKRIIIRVNPEEVNLSDPTDLGIDVYELKKFERTNQNTCVNQRPLVVKGQKVQKGDLLADGQSTYRGELALGKNVLVAFMPWRGYNFEDAIVISERLVKEDVYTSIHIEELELEARETKIGNEEITRQIPGVPERALAHLDEFGIVKIGTYVKPGDILVGKVTPKGETQLTPEEKLLQAIFGEKSRDVKDSSLRCPPGVEGMVVDVKVFARKTGERKNYLVEHVERMEKEELERELEKRKRLIVEGRNSVVKSLVLGRTLDKEITVRKKTYGPGTVVDEQVFDALLNYIVTKPENLFDDQELCQKISEARERARSQVEMISKIYEEKINSVGKKSELPSGVYTLVKVYIAQKRKIKVGDKMAGRHGNKGVISVILPVEEMPFLEDGTPVDIVLNPLGVPSRMNVGQILETHLGWASKELGKKLREMSEEGADRKEIVDFLMDIYGVGDVGEENRKYLEDFLQSLDEEDFRELIELYGEMGVPMATPVFEGASEEHIKELLKMAGLPEDGKTVLYDGRTGEPFDMRVTVGYMHMLKLIHMVDDKIHARSTGPYSLVTQQPLGGRAQFGGQRLGEMEVWALEAHGAAHTLQEMLTVKSDDIEGRTKVYESIVKGKYMYQPGVPESFRVLVRELKALGLDVKCEDGAGMPCDHVEIEEEQP
ncbi:MAG: DNA-directed RNA polymerase subunit beta, partial [Aquificaceae bacterium]|nr:DNA-directed RNA polymerase subunit beta [Aquificaceae bacterium]